MKNLICLMTLAMAGLNAPMVCVGGPDRFPEVPLTADCQPRYAVIAVDPQTNQVGYLLFDGNVNAGYGRMYVWVPGDAHYGKPVAVAAAGEAGKLAPFLISGTNRQGHVSMTWAFTWAKRQAGGKQQWFDYLTGKTITKETDAVTYTAFGFNLDYQAGGRGASAGSSGAASLDVGIVGEIPTSDAWTNLPPSIAPWTQLNFFMTMTPQYEKDKAKLQFKGRLNYWHWGCTVRSLPVDSKLVLAVAPYMEPAVYSNELSVAEAFGQAGVAVEVSPGWYDMYWDMSCEGLGVVARRDYDVSPAPYPVPKPTAFVP